MGKTSECTDARAVRQSLPELSHIPLDVCAIAFARLAADRLPRCAGRDAERSAEPRWPRCRCTRSPRCCRKRPSQFDRAPVERLAGGRSQRERQQNAHVWYDRGGGRWIDIGPHVAIGTHADPRRTLEPRDEHLEWAIGQRVAVAAAVTLVAEVAREERPLIRRKSRGRGQPARSGSLSHTRGAARRRHHGLCRSRPIP